MWPSWVFGSSGFQSAPPINSTLPKGESMGPHWLGSPWYNYGILKISQIEHFFSKRRGPTHPEDPSNKFLKILNMESIISKT